MEQEHIERPDIISEIRFDGGFAHAFMATVGVVATAPDFEGLDQWAYVAFAALSPDLRRDIRVFIDHCGAPIVFSRLTEEHPDISGFDAFMDWLASLSDETIRTLLGRFWEHVTRKDGAATGVSPLLTPNQEDPGEIAEYIGASQSAWAREMRADESYVREMATVLSDPGRFRARLIRTCRGFWNVVYQEEYARTRGGIQRVIAMRKKASYPRDFLDAYLAITGKALPAPYRDSFSNPRLVTFVPCCYAGPYALIGPDLMKDDQLLVIFNARSQALEGGHPATALPALFPPLKALADETRLQILAMLADGELYGQRVVDRLDISQPSVSRHLKLMVIAGVLNERREGGKKLYSIREETLSDISRQLALLAGWASEEE